MQPKDYCTLWPDFIGDIWIGGCCRVHDYAYEQGLPRLEADYALGQCVSDLGLPVIGVLMAVATAICGKFFYRPRKK